MQKPIDQNGKPAVLIRHEKDNSMSRKLINTFAGTFPPFSYNYERFLLCFINLAT